ncbi:MAG: hypothetical protein WBX09_17215 [Terracidiphilus sp.]
MRTRYTWTNLTILTAGTLLSAALIPYTGWVFSSVPALAGASRLGEDLDVLAVVLALPAFLLGWRWPRVSAYATWTLTFFVVLFAVVARELWPMLILIAAVGGVSGLASWVEANSARAASRAAGE